jgi:hypothetical protein
MRTFARRSFTSHFAKVVVSLAVVGGSSLLMASPAAACFHGDPAETHCYAIAEWPNVSIAETLIDANTSKAEVPEAAGTEYNGTFYEPREQDEEWSDFPPHMGINEWIEVGDTTGYIWDKKFESSPVFYEADQSWSYPTMNAKNYNEVDYPTQSPGTGWWDATTYTENSGSWCATIQSTDAFCFPGLKQYASDLQDGLEYAANNDPERNGGAYATNTGQVIGYAKNSAGSVTQWTGAHLRYIDEAGDPWPPAGSWGVCGKLNALGQGNGAITVEAPAWLDWPECSSAAEFSNDVATAPTKVAAGKTTEETLAAFGAPKPTAPGLMAGYSAPSSGDATLSLSGVEGVAKEIAGDDAGDSAPERVRSVLGTSLDSALAVAAPGVKGPQEISAGIAAWDQSSTDVITMDGGFVLGNAPRPASESPPSGHVLSIVIDAHTGTVDAVSLGGTEPDLATLGAVRQLG